MDGQFHWRQKTGPEVLTAFQSLWRKRPPPQKLWTYRGTEVQKNNVELYSTENDEKSSIVERWNRSIMGNMWKYFSANNTIKYIDILPNSPWADAEELFEDLLMSWGPFWESEDKLKIYWGSFEDLLRTLGSSMELPIHIYIIIRIYLKPLLLFENQQSILHLYWKQTLFSFWISSESVCVVHQQAHLCGVLLWQEYLAWTRL